MWTKLQLGKEIGSLCKPQLAKLQQAAKEIGEMEADTLVRTADPQPDCDEDKGSFTLRPVQMWEYL